MRSTSGDPVPATGWTGTATRPLERFVCVLAVTTGRGFRCRPQSVSRRVARADMHL